MPFNPSNCREVLLVLSPTRNVIQLQAHGSKNPNVLYQEMWLHVSKLLSAATSQRLNWSGPSPV